MRKLQAKIQSLERDLGQETVQVPRLKALVQQSTQKANVLNKDLQELLVTILLTRKFLMLANMLGVAAAGNEH